MPVPEMAKFAVPTLPTQSLVDGQTSIPPPPAELFDTYFGGFLPERHTITSALGRTTYYILSSSSSPSSGVKRDSSTEPNPNPSSSEGAKPARRVILMHGASTPSINLVPLAKEILSLSSGRTEILLYDLWGHGLSSTPVQPMTPALFHAQILHLMNHLSWPRVHLLGFSISGSLACSFAAYHPAAILSLTLVGPAGLLRRDADVSTWEVLVRSGGPGGLWAALARQNILNFVDGGVAPKPPAGWRERVAKGETLYDMEAVQVWQRENHAGHVAALVGMYFDGGVFDEHGAYRTVAQGPVGKKSLVVLGEHDEFFLVERMRMELDNCGWIGGFEVVKDVGHLVVRQKPRETAGLVLSFWDGLDEE